RGRGWRGPATGELEGADARAPVELARGRDVLIGVPEGAVIGRVDRDAAVVAPAREAERPGLRAGSGDDRALPLGHRPRKITGQPSGVADLRVGRAAGEAKAQAHIAGLIHGEAAHPAVVSVGRIGALLKDRGGRARAPDLVPANAGRAARGDAVVG